MSPDLAVSRYILFSNAGNFIDNVYKN